MEEYILKVVVIGSSGVGKTSLLLRYIDDQFSENLLATIGVDFRMKTFVKDGHIAKMSIWDTAGQERFRNIVSLFYRGAEGLIVVFDVTDEDSFRRVPAWLREAGAQTQADCITILVGNKADKFGRAVDKETAQALADEYGIEYIETSAKTAENVHQVFDTMADTILKRKVELGLAALATDTMGQSFSIKSSEVTESNWCYWNNNYCY